MTVAIGTRKEELDTPALCLDAEAVERNLRRMADFFAPLRSKLRPHFKTHKSPLLAQMQLAAGAAGITCAKLGEAELLAQAGIRDILVANQVVSHRKIQRLVHLAGYTDVMVAVDQENNVRDIADAASNVGVRVRVLIEVNIGMNRCGVEPGKPAVDLAERILRYPSLRLEGIMGYEGHAVMIPDPAERERTAKTAMGLLIGTRDSLVKAGISVPIVSGGGTGTYKTTARYEGVTELQAGSYLTMDGQYRERVGLKEFDYALTLLSTIIHAGRDTAVGDAGMKSLSTDFGMPLVLEPPGWRVSRLAEEHCFLERVKAAGMDAKDTEVMDVDVKDRDVPGTDAAGPSLKPGDRIELVPGHGCTTINLHDAYHVTRKGVLAAVWPISARGKAT